jgi:hypothetical protein
LLHFDRRHPTQPTTEPMRRSKCSKGEAPVTSGLAPPGTGGNSTVRD